MWPWCCSSPISLPAWSENDAQQYVPCDQGLVVVLKPESSDGRPVKIIDATKINNGASTTDLSTSQINQLRDILLEESNNTPSIQTTEVERKILKGVEVWPSIASFSKIPVRPEDLANAYTLESMVELFKYKHHIWKQTQTGIFKGVGLPSGF